jgi:hypothetical protein
MYPVALLFHLVMVLETAWVEYRLYLKDKNNNWSILGVKYAMLSMQFTLSTLLRHYKVTSSNYKTIQEIDFGMTIVARPKRGYIISIEKRNRYI